MVKKPLVKSPPLSTSTYLAGLAEAAAHRKLQKQYDDLLRPFGLSKNQWLIIGLVMDTGSKGAPVSELAEQVGCTMPYMTNTVNLLESKRILHKKTKSRDSRYRYVTLSRSYLPTARKIEKTLQKGLK